MERAHVLVVEDSPAMRMLIARTRADDGRRVQRGWYGMQALQKLTSDHYDLVPRRSILD